MIQTLWLTNVVGLAQFSTHPFVFVIGQKMYPIVTKPIRQCRIIRTAFFLQVVFIAFGLEKYISFWRKSLFSAIKFVTCCFNSLISSLSLSTWSRKTWFAFCKQLTLTFSWFSRIFLASRLFFAAILFFLLRSQYFSSLSVCIIPEEVGSGLASSYCSQCPFWKNFIALAKFTFITANSKEEKIVKLNVEK